MGTASMERAQKTIAERIVEYGATKVGQKIPGAGECWDLPNTALDNAGAKTPNELGRGTYVWGDKIDNLTDAQPGDILQFEGVQIKRTWMRGDGRSAWETFNFRRRHSAIVETVDKELFFTTLNLHIKVQGDPKADLQRVTRLRINLSRENYTGKIFLYRPVPR